MMDTVEMIERLTTRGIPKGDYAIGRIEDNAISLLVLNGMWHCVFEERGVPVFDKIFSSEGEACEQAFGLITGDAFRKPVQRFELELLAAALKNSKILTHYDAGSGGDPIEHTTAYAFLEILNSASRLVKEIYPKMQSGGDPEVTDELLHDFREEIRHINYHIRDSNFLSVVIGSSD